MKLNGDGDIAMIIVENVQDQVMILIIIVMNVRMAFISSVIKQKEMVFPVHVMIIAKIMDFI